MSREFLDKVGMCCASLCGIHCFLFPFLMAFIPSAGVAWLWGETFEWSFLLFSLSIAVFTLAQGFATHGRRVPMALASIGFATFVTTKLLAGGHEANVVTVEVFLYLLAGALICSGHYFNHRLCHNTHHCKCN